MASRLGAATSLCVAALTASCKIESKAAAVPMAAAATPHSVTVHAKDFAFVGPDTVPAGMTTITLVNDGPGIHHLQLIRLDSGKTAADLGAAFKNPGPFPAWAHLASGPNPPMPGAQTTATLDLAAGTYVMLCFVDVPDHVPHFAKGMMRVLTVIPFAGPAPTLGAADVTITLTEYAFALSDSIKAGPRTFDVKTAGRQPHEVALFKLLPGKTKADVMKWGASYQGPVPATILGGVSSADSGMTVRFSADITPGDYLLLCFVPDAKDGKPHLMHGMVRAFKVT